MSLFGDVFHSVQAIVFISYLPSCMVYKVAQYLFIHMFNADNSDIYTPVTFVLINVVQYIYQGSNFTTAPWLPFILALVPKIFGRSPWQ